jgi:hypothetical protein
LSHVRDGGTFAVVIADRTFEAWLLAGSSALQKCGAFVKGNSSRFEGHLGEQHKKGQIELTKCLGREYAKTTDGPALFAKLDFSEARDHANGQGSKSLDKFLRSLGV